MKIVYSFDTCSYANYPNCILPSDPNYPEYPTIRFAQFVRTDINLCSTSTFAAQTGYLIAELYSTISSPETIPLPYSSSNFNVDRKKFGFNTDNCLKISVSKVYYGS